MSNVSSMSSNLQANKLPSASTAASAGLNSTTPVVKRASSAGGDNNVPQYTGRSGRSSSSRSRKLAAKSSQEGTTAMKARLHHLFDQIEKEFDILLTENIAQKERIDVLEEVILGSSNTPPDGSAHKALQQKLTSQIKRDSMVAASQISQKIKSTYRLKASGRIFNKTQSNIRGQLLASTDELHKDGVWYVSTSSKYNRTFIATASADGTACICDITNGKTIVPLSKYTGHQASSVNCIRFHPQYDLIITASGDSGAHIWRPSYEQKTLENEEKEDEPMVIKQALLELSGHTSVVTSACFLTTVDQCVTASWDRTANIYDLHSGELVVQLAGHDQELTDVAAHPSAPLIVTSSHDTTFRLWDFREAIHSVCVFQGHSECVNSATFIGADKVVSGSDDRTVKVWDLKNMRSPLTNIHFESPVNKLGISQSNSHIAIPLENRNVRIYDSSGNRICRLPRSQHDRMVTCASFVPNLNAHSSGSGVQLFTCAFDRKVCWWSLAPSEKS